MFLLKTFWLAFVVSAITGGSLALFPLVGLHGVESALILGLVLPPLVAAFGASTVAPMLGSYPRGLDFTARAVGGALFILSPALLLLGANALHFRQCTPWEGLAFMLLGPGIGCVLAATVGVWIGAPIASPLRAAWLAALIPIAGLGLGLWLLWSTPAIYAYSSFAGYFPGSLYDQGVEISESYVTYRGGTLLALLTLWLLLEAMWQPKKRQLSLGYAIRNQTGWLLSASVGLVLVGSMIWHGESLGHRISTKSVAKALGKTEESARCIIHMPRSLDAEAANRLAEDCDFSVYAAEEALGVTVDEPIVAYFFVDPQQKKDLIGAGNTFVAKPWRNEVYLQLRPWPHPVLGHEVVHAVAAKMARGPLGIAGTFGGLIPNPGIIEGTAVAVAWRSRDGLNPDQWSRVMLEYERLPTAETLMSLRFSTLPAIRAYNAAGSLIRFLLNTRGQEALRQAYETGKVTQLRELEKTWHVYLNTVEVSDRDRGIATVGLNEKSIFSATCPHRVTRLKEMLAADVQAGDQDRMIDSCREILAIDNQDAGARAILVGALASQGQADTALAELEVMRDHLEAPQPMVAFAWERLADAHWERGDLAQAQQIYAHLLELPQPDDPARAREVKALAAQAGGRQSELIFALLAGRRPSAATAVHLAQELSEVRPDGLGAYLQARQLIQEGRFDMALPLLEHAKQLGLPTERLKRENERLLAVTLYATGSLDRSQRAWEAIYESDRGLRDESTEWLERIKYTRKANQAAILQVPQ